MIPPNKVHISSSRPFFLATLISLFVSACSAPVPRLTGPAADFEDSKEMFRRGNFDRALEFTDKLVSDPAARKVSDRARVLRAVILAGEIKAYKALAEVYTKGVEATKNPQFQAAYEQQRHDNLQLGAKRALELGEVALQLTRGGTLPKELSLEAPYPSVEGPLEVKEFDRILEGGWLEPEQQGAATVDAVRKGIDDALAEIAGGDRAKARSALAAGPIKLDGVDFALYLDKMILEGASLFDHKHMRDPQKYRTLLNVGDGTAKAASAMLKENPDKAREGKVKKLQDQIKSALRAA
jgi:hypothetical protein